MARGYSGLSGFTDYSGLDRFRSQIMEAVNRQNQYESLFTQTVKNELENRAIGGVLSDYARDVSPTEIAPERTLDVPAGFAGLAVPSPAMGGAPIPIPTEAKTQTIRVPGITEQPTRETQYNAAAKAFSRLAQYGPKGMNVARQLQENLATYAKLFPFQKPEYPEQLLGVTTVKSSTGDEAGIAQFGRLTSEGRPFVTAHAVLNFTPPSGGSSSKGENFYGTAFKYSDAQDPNMPTGINPDFDQKERMKVENQLGTEEDRVLRLSQTAQAELGRLESKQQLESLFNDPRLKTVKPDQIAAQQQVVEDANRRLKYIRAHKDILHKTFDVAKGGGNPPKGGGIRKKGAGHKQ